MYVVKVVKNLHLYLITKIEITNEIMFLLTFAIQYLWLLQSTAFWQCFCCGTVCPLCPIKVSFQKLIILISPNQPFSAENTTRTRQNVHRTNSTDEYGWKRNSFDFGRWSVKSGRAWQCKSTAVYGTALTLALIGAPTDCDV
jgi:hypothetical protein